MAWQRCPILAEFSQVGGVVVKDIPAMVRGLEWMIFKVLFYPKPFGDFILHSTFQQRLENYLINYI